MTTVVLGKKGDRITVITQQYLCGLYVALYKEGTKIPTQLSIDMKEKEYHKMVRRKNKWVPEESTVL